MAGSKAIAIFILANVIFFTCASSTSCPTPTPKKPPSTAPPAPKKPAKCPKDTLKFGVCADWLGLVHEVLGAKPSSACCALVKGLADLEAAVCLCTALKANVLGVINVKIPLAISVIINSCGKKVPEGFKCA
ncbi:hypothetical protein ACH5RR_023866 [Cinchona calisaya]|uniref:Bifunctional inhibitor/plant lipid transfer protein/seed storage helical domain-containing protein n=1 Tax=Cinchona calisaya TaxID=153742 RepID=A0ABD2ZCZ0_9GENT